MQILSRRAAMKAAGVLVGGVGAAAAVPAAAHAATSAPSSRAFVLHGTAMRLLGTKARKPGDTTTARGALSSAAGTAQRGEVFITGTLLAPGSLLHSDVGALETHLFVLDDGTLTGTGTVGQDGVGTFTVTGGSGAYAGMGGTYRSRHSADHSGGGTAIFTFSGLNTL